LRQRVAHGCGWDGVSSGFVFDLDSGGTVDSGGSTDGALDGGGIGGS
jgi:hypothetical protein